MSGIVEPLSLRGGARVLALGTVVMAVAAATMVAVGTQDARLLRLGVLAALWAALLGAFSTARARREISSRAEHVDQLRAVYQLQLQREVLARREHALTVERELREQAELSQQREIGQLRAELSAIGANLAQLLGGNSLVERVTLRAESTRLLPLPVNRAVTTSAAEITAAAPATANSRVAGAELRFGPSRPVTPDSDEQGRHGAPGRRRSGSNNNGTRSVRNGAHSNGGGAPAAPGQPPKAIPAAQAQRTVQDLLAAHGAASTPRRRRTHEADSG
ncbi:MAG: DUF6779 domain-containing protein [Pseudonocardiaceae bacterium]